MTHKLCAFCVHQGRSFSTNPCHDCTSNAEAVESRKLLKISTPSIDAWTPNDKVKLLIEYGRQLGVQESLNIANTHEILKMV